MVIHLKFQVKMNGAERGTLMKPLRTQPPRVSAMCEATVQSLSDGGVRQSERKWASHLDDLPKHNGRWELVKTCYVKIG